MVVVAAGEGKRIYEREQESRELIVDQRHLWIMRYTTTATITTKATIDDDSDDDSDDNSDDDDICGFGGIRQRKKKSNLDFMSNRTKKSTRRKGKG